ncbi:hypothetical protein QMK17_15830 [Rhodococcus sp. G-MC3]|nr:hypothetical protein [Rhodococcus sp. G-MC3]MDJ0394794.1 hypothetical protein [Rhodococcus sp. G-MC3]
MEIRPLGRISTHVPGGLSSQVAFAHVGLPRPYVTGWLVDATGNAKAGLWIVGAVVLLVSVLRGGVGAGRTPDADPALSH